MFAICFRWSCLLELSFFHLSSWLFTWQNSQVVNRRHNNLMYMKCTWKMHHIIPLLWKQKQNENKTKTSLHIFKNTWQDSFLAGSLPFAMTLRKGQDVIKVPLGILLFPFSISHISFFTRSLFFKMTCNPGCCQYQNK